MVTTFRPRYMAFVDILGFKSLVDQMAKDPDLFRLVRDTLKELQKQARSFGRYRESVNTRRAKRVRLLPDIDLQMAAFSDCFVISETRPAWHVLAAVQALASRYLQRGILTRGGIVHGLAYHRGSVVFGPAVIEAYKLESQVASYPRILVSDEVREACWGYHRGLCEEQLLLRDADGSWFVNALSPPLSEWEALSSPGGRDMKPFLRETRKVISGLLRATRQDVSHRTKVAWLANQFNSRAALHGVTPLKIEVGEV